MRRRLVGAGLVAVLAFSGVACDQEDIRDVEEGVEEVEDVGEEVEKEFDENVDTDGKDD